MKAFLLQKFSRSERKQVKTLAFNLCLASQLMVSESLTRFWTNDILRLFCSWNLNGYVELNHFRLMRGWNKVLMP